MDQPDVNHMIESVLKHVMDNKNQLYSKAYPQNIMDQIEKEQLLLIEKKWAYPTRKMNMIEFVKLFVSIIDHKQNEILYLVMGLIEIFKDMVISTNSNQNSLLITDITSYICEKTEQQDYELKIQEQRVPAPRKFEQNIDRIRHIDVDAPQVVNSTTMLQHIMPNKITTDKIKHSNGTVQSGIYIEELNKMITLDSLGTRLNVYNIDCQIDTYITLKSDKNHDEDKEAIIMGFAWSSRQQRIGICVKSHYLCFFDYHDAFKTPRMFSTSQFSQDHQTAIWCLNNYNFWITTDASNKLYKWDVQEQKPSFIFQSSRIKSPIIEVTEVLHLKLMATASLDKQIAFWDIQTGQIKIQINMEEHGGIHSMIYSYHFQVLIACGYSTNIQIFQVHPIYMDVTLVGKLQGHVSMLTAIQMLGISPILCSGDDIGTIRLWNIKNFQCVQCLSFGRRTQILKILDISSKGLICFLGSRVNMITLDDRQKTKTQENYPVRIQFQPGSDQLVVASRKELLFINIHTGRVKKIYSSLLPDQEDEIAQFRPLNHFNRFILGDSRGGINVYQSSNGELIKSMKGHQTEVNHLRTDIVNNLIISASWDHIQIQRELIGLGSAEVEILREVTKFQQGTEITIIELSVHHNLLLASSQTKLSIYDYELLRLLGEVNADKDSDITFLTFIKSYNLLAMGTNVVKIFSFLIRDQQEIYLDIIAILDPYYLLNDVPYVPYTSVPIQQSFRSSKTSKSINEALFSLTEVHKHKLPEDQLNFNPTMISSAQRKGFDVPTKCLVLQEENSIHLYIATNKGKVFMTDLSHIITFFQLQTCPNASEKLNYNAHRFIREEYKNQFNKCKQSPFQTEPYIEKNWKSILLISKDALIMTVQAQKKAIICLYLLQLDIRYIVTTAVNGFINIHNLQGILVASVNINHPLPILWSLVYTKREQQRKKIFYALRIIGILKRQAQTNAEKQTYNVSASITQQDYVMEQDQSPKQIKRLRKSTKMVPLLSVNRIQNLAASAHAGTSEQNNHVIIMSDEYSPRDLKFNQVREMYKSELQGPSLKQMESYTRTQDSQQLCRIEEVAQLEKEKIYEQKELERQKLTDKGNQVNFLDEDYHDKLLNHYRSQNENSIRQILEAKLETQVKNSRIIVGQETSEVERGSVPRSKKIFPQVKKHDKNTKSLTKNFFDYANDKNLIISEPPGSSSTIQSFRNNSYISQILSSPRSQFNPTYYMKNIDQVGLINLGNSQKWLGGQKQEKTQLTHVLQNLKLKVIKSKNQNPRSIDSLIAGSNIINNMSTFSSGLLSAYGNKIVDIPESEQQTQADKEIDRLVVIIQSRVQEDLKVKSQIQKQVY